MKKLAQRSDVLVGIGIIIVSAPLLIYLFGTQFIRYMADDFCPTPSLSQIIATDNSVDYILSAPLHLAGVRLAPLVCILCLIVLWLGLFLVLRLALRQATFAILGASLFISVLLASATNVEQSIFWQTGMLKYTLPLVLNIFTVWLILQRSLQPGLTLILCFIAVLLAGSIADAFAVAQVVLFGVLWVILRNQTIISRRLFVCAVAAALVLGIALLLPGTQARFSTEAANPLIAADPSAISRFLHGLVRGFKDPLIYTFVRAPLGWVAVLVLPFVAAQFNLISSAVNVGFAQLATNPRQRLLAVLSAVGLVALALGLCMLMWAGGYVGEGRLPTRAWIEGQYFVLAASAAAAYIFGLVFAALTPSGYTLVRRYAVALIAVVLVASSINVSARGVSVVRELKDYSVLADQRDAQLRAGVLTVSELPSFGLNDLGVPWVDQCLQAYYGLPQPPRAIQ